MKLLIRILVNCINSRIYRAISNLNKWKNTLLRCGNYFVLKKKYSTSTFTSYGWNLQVVEKEVVVFTRESFGNRREMRLISIFSLAKLFHLFKHSMSLPFFPYENEREYSFLMESSFCPFYMTYLTFQIMDCVVNIKGSFLTILIKMIFDFPFRISRFSFMLYYKSLNEKECKKVWKRIKYHG